MRRRSTLGASALLALVLAGPASAQAPDPLTATTNIGEFIDRDASVVVTFNRPPAMALERVAVYIDRTDVTGLFRRAAAGQELRYEQGVVQLPPGEHEMIVYRVPIGGGEWDEIARESFTTLGRFGFRPGDLDPSLTLGWETRLSDGYDPESAAPRRPDANVDLQFRLSTEHVRENLSISSEVSLVGTNRVAQALRFREEGEDAPKLDLSSYRVDAARGPVSVSVGGVSSGGQRHLIQGFSARGASVAIAPSERVDLSFAAQNGSQEVGWSNLLGMEEPDHRVVSGAVGIEALPTPGALRVEFTGMSGSILPRNGFNQGAVNDAEESHGLGVRLTANAIDRRLRLDAGWATSTFDNPDDPTLDQGFDVVEVEEEAASARYLEASFDAIRNLSLGGSRTARLSVGMKHERVDPLYRSLGAYASADRLIESWDIRGDIAGISIQTSLADARNNLDDVPSILTTKTERTGVSLGIPLGRVLQKQTSWLPQIQLRRDRTHQFGEELPENGGFSESHVPDQVSLNRTASVEWRLSKVSFGFEWNRSEQDNRQEGREDADRNVTRRGIKFGFNPFRSLRLGLDLGEEESENVERDETDTTLRWGGQLQWQAFDRSSLSVRLSDTETEDLLLTRRRANRQVNVQWASVLPYLDRVQGQYFLRWSRTINSSSDTTFDRNDRTEAWWLDLGLNLTFFQE